MPLSGVKTLIIILSVAFGAMITRFAPFFLFPERKKTPEYIIYLGNAFPPAAIGLLVIYCLKNVSFGSTPHGLPEWISILAIVVLHKWKNNVLLSILGGTALYMVLVQAVFC